MTQPADVPQTPTRQQAAFLNYHALLNEINVLGIEKFVMMIDDSTEEELTDLLTAANVVMARVQAFRQKTGY